MEKERKKKKEKRNIEASKNLNFGNLKRDLDDKSRDG